MVVLHFGEAARAQRGLMLLPNEGLGVDLWWEFVKEWQETVEEEEIEGENRDAKGVWL